MRQYIHYGKTISEFDKSLVGPIKNIDHWTKPDGGFWASSVDAEYGWKEWCYDNDFCRPCDDTNSFKFILTDTAKILHIYSIDDINGLPVKSISKGWFTDTMNLDFEKLCEEYDAIELHLSGNHFNELYYALYGWDCDSILIMNPDIIVPIGDNLINSKQMSVGETITIMLDLLNR